MNASDKDFNCSPNDAIRVLDASTLGYYKIDHKALPQNLSSYQFENLNQSYNQFNKYSW